LFCAGVNWFEKQLHGVTPVKIAQSNVFTEHAFVKDWNVVISVYQDGFRRALSALKEYGSVERSHYHNVLVMHVEDPTALLEAIERKTETNTALYDAISRVAPAMCTVDFHSIEEFKEKIASILIEWLTRLTGGSFHVRLHRRGDRHGLQTSSLERLFDDLLLDAMAAKGVRCMISFTDPDAIIVIDTVDDRAGIGLWTHEDIARHRLLRPD
jgi:tRNA(Ser,Leu) C12 N-acetylase TAN1